MIKRNEYLLPLRPLMKIVQRLDFPCKLGWNGIEEALKMRRSLYNE